MFRALQGRLGHYGLLLVAAGLLFFLRLGAPSLWDVDESHNAEAAREMAAAGNWVVPTFNYQLRVDKPALLYWLQIGAYALFGVNEFAARFPSALAALATLLLVYELGRSLFDAPTGLLAGILLASTVLFCAVAHFANPDALLNCFTAAVMLGFWLGWLRQSQWWFVPCGICSALAVLTKGPVGLVLPFAVTTAFLFWSRRLDKLRDRRLALGVLAFLLVALPWYVWVGVETKAVFLREFIVTHNVERFRAPMEGHRGSFLYYLVVLLVGFAPWSLFLGAAGWYGMGRAGRADAAAGDEPASALPPSYRFLWSWIGVYFVFFSLAGTKLPNYIAPLFPPAALLTARFLERWRRQLINPPAWLTACASVGLAGVGLATAVGLMIVGGALDLSFVRGRKLEGMEAWAALGTIPVAGALAAGWTQFRGRRTGLLVAWSVAAFAFVGGLAAFGSVAVDAHKAPRHLSQALPADQLRRESRIGCFDYYQPSLVYYCRREVDRLEDDREALTFLASPLDAYLFVSASAWDRLETQITFPHRTLGRRRDLYRNCEVVLVTNRLADWAD